MNKKAAIEFSMTTIMVIIIGVAVLALGLTWVRGTFTQVGQLTEVSLENAETILGEVGFTGKVGAPSTLILDQKDAKKFKVLIRNDEETTEGKFTLSINRGSTLHNCFEVYAVADEVQIPAGEIGELIGGVITTGCAHNSNGFLNVVVKKDSDTGNYGTEAVAVQVP